MQEQFTEEELEGMSDAEREALEDDMVEDETTESDEESTEEEESQEEESQGEETEESTEEQTEEPEQEEAAQTEETQEEESQEEEKPSRLDEIKGELSALKEKRDDGDIDYSEYEEQKSVLDGESQKIVINEEVGRQVAEQRLADAQERSRKEFQSYFHDGLVNKPGYEMLKDPEANQSFRNRMLRISNAPEGEGKSFEQLGDMATAELQSIGIPIGKTPVKDNPNPKPGKKSKADVIIPKTLGDVSASETNYAESKHAHLERLQGEELIDALGSGEFKTAAEEDAWLEGRS